jgi:hypothetical protein
MTGEQLKKIVAEFEAERNAKKAYKEGLQGHGHCLVIAPSAGRFAIDRNAAA